MNKYLTILPLILLIGLIFGLVPPPSFSQSNFQMDYEYKVYPLPGSLNSVPVFNSNSPEIIRTEGILLSTFPPENSENPDAHLNIPFKGRFDIFTHHISVERERGDFSNIYQGILLQNPTSKVVTLKVLAGATYTTRPDAPFIKLPDYLNNNDGNFFSGPGDRSSQDILREKSYLNDRIIKINPGDFYLLLNEAIPIAPLSASNGRTALFNLESDGSLYIADLALFEKDFLFWKDQKPELKDWLYILKTGKLAQQRDNVPTPVDRKLDYDQPFFYGRVAGVAIGGRWKARIENKPKEFQIPQKNKGVAYVLNTVFGNTYGTGQVQSGNVIKRYPDTAYQSHANYGVIYEIDIPLYNNNKESTSVAVSFDSPLRFYHDQSQPNISYYDAPPEKITFRGEFRIQYKSYLGIEKEKFIHVVQRFGQQGLPLVSLFMEPGDRRMVKITYVYPSDATPPHVLTITSN